MDINSMHNLVLLILNEEPEAREDDVFLYAKVCERLGIPDKSFYDILYDHSKYDLPSTETVRRTRQKVQELYPSLRAKRNKHKRMSAQNIYRAYAKTASRQLDLFSIIGDNDDAA